MSRRRKHLSTDRLLHDSFTERVEQVDVPNVVSDSFANVGTIATKKDGSATRSSGMWIAIEAAGVAVLIAASVVAMQTSSRGKPIFYDSFERRAVVERIESGLSELSSVLKLGFTGE